MWLNDSVRSVGILKEIGLRLNLVVVHCWLASNYRAVRMRVGMGARIGNRVGWGRRT
jgi:hypothetical protein